MRAPFELPPIPEVEQQPWVKQLLSMVEKLARRVEQLEEEKRQLEEERAVLKGERKRRRFKSSR